LTGRHHLAFQARDRAMVDAFHTAALAHGGKDNGAPGERPYHPGYYAGFVLDPDGNNIEAVYHGEAKAQLRLGSHHLPAAALTRGQRTMATATGVMWPFITIGNAAGGHPRGR
jgi:hypothetical protein